jgi:hypothetical protein
MDENQMNENHTPEHPFRVRPGLCVESEILLRKLKDGKPGDVLTDAELTELCGFDTSPSGGKGYSNLHTAQDRCRREYGLNWQREIGMGSIRCLQSKETKDRLRDHGIRRVRRQARRMRIEALTVKPGDLTDEERREWRAQIAAFRLAEVMVTKRTEKKLLPYCGDARVDPKRLLAVLGNGKKVEEKPAE